MSLNPKVTDQGNKVRLDWTPDLTGQGYRLYVDGVAVSRTFKPDASSTTFAKPDSGPHRYGVRKMDVVGALEEATWPVDDANALIPPQNLATLQSQGASFVLGPGNYGNQTFSLNKPVTYELQNGAILGDVTFNPGSGGVTIKAANPLKASIGRVKFGPATGAPCSDITIENLDGILFQGNNCRRIRLKGCDWGPCVNERPHLALAGGVGTGPVDFLIEDSWIHGMQASPPDNPNFHADGILIYSGNGIVVRRCVFGRTPAGVVDSNGGTGDLAIFYRTDPNIANIRVEDNAAYSAPWAKPGDASYNVQYDSKIYNLTFSNNRFPKGMLDTGPGANPPVAPPPNWPPA